MEHSSGQGLAPRAVPARRRGASRWLMGAVMAALVTVVLVPGAAGQALASEADYQVVGTGGLGVCRRTAPATGATRDGCIPEGSWVSVTCWVVGEPVTDYWGGQLITWDRWARTPDGRYVADIYLNSTAWSFPECGTIDVQGSTSAWDLQQAWGDLHGSGTTWDLQPAWGDLHGPAPDQAPPAEATRESRAVEWAVSQLGVVHTSETSDGMWSGWCETFVEVAYGTRWAYASAIDNYYAQLGLGRIHTDADPPAGALVFYDWAGYGHVGISIGGGQVISTQGYDIPLPVRQHSVTGIGLTYLGWAYAPDHWPGR